MERSQANEYVTRINKVSNYIDQHLAEPMTLGELSNVAGFSEYHFHRIFAAMTGETLFSYIQRLRVEGAATHICMYSGEKTITQIAQDFGFSSSAVFSRTFKKRFGISPSEFRKSNHGQEESNLGQLLRNRGKAMPGHIGYTETALAGGHTEAQASGHTVNTRQWRFDMKPEVKIEKFETMRVAYIRYVGPYAGDAKLFEGLYGRLAAFATPRGIDMSTSYIIYHDDPAITDEQKLRVSVCVPIGSDVEVSGEICEMEIAGVDYAVGSFVLGTDEYGQAWQYMFAEWLPTSGYKPAAAPALERYCDECSVNEKMKVDICIPVQVM